MKKKKMLRQTAVNIPPTILVLVLAFIFVFPMIWMVATSLKNQSAAIAATASYALTRIPFSGRNIWFGLIVVSMMIPTQLTLVPLFKMMRQLNLTNTPWAVILPSLACMSAVFLMKQFGQSIPSELFQAARIDGCSELAIFFRHMMAAATIGMLPTLLIFIIFQKYFVKGITLGGVKG